MGRAADHDIRINYRVIGGNLVSLGIDSGMVGVGAFNVYSNGSAMASTNSLCICCVVIRSGVFSSGMNGLQCIEAVGNSVVLTGMHGLLLIGFL